MKMADPVELLGKLGLAFEHESHTIVGNKRRLRFVDKDRTQSSCKSEKEKR